MGVELQKHIDEKVFTIHEEKLRDYLGASAIGHECGRHVQYYWLQLLGRIPTEMIEPRVRRIFDRGNIYEAEIVKWMKISGFVFEDDNSKLEFSSLEDKFKGHVDGVLLQGPLPLPYPVLWECKCVNAKGFERLVQHGVRVQYPKYYTQVQLYMYYLKLDQCLFTAINANDMSIYDEAVKFNKQHAEEMISRVEQIFDKTDKNKFVPKVKSQWNCRFCEYKKYCEE